MWAHPEVIKEWSTLCRANGKNRKRLSRDVPTYWNSTFELRNQSYKYSELLFAFFATNMTDIMLLENNWIVCNKILEVLTIFNVVLILCLSIRLFPLNSTNLLQLQKFNFYNVQANLSNSASNNNRIIGATTKRIAGDKKKRNTVFTY